MILFWNVMVFTDLERSRVGHSNTNRYDRFDVFKYTLASYSCIDKITDIIIYCELGNPYKDRMEELKTYVNSIFKDKNIKIFPYSLTSQSHWQKALFDAPELLSAKAVFFSCNDDHVFIDYDLEVLYEGIDLMEREPQTQINTLYYSHWPEVLSITYELDSFEHVGRYLKQEALSSLPAQIVNGIYFQHVFFDLIFENEFFRRTDGFLTNWYPELGRYAFPSKEKHPKVKMFVPLRELVRHFDGYVHCGTLIKDCPRLEIPNGFFENSIKINYCSERKEGFYNLDPTSESPYWREGNKDGCDDKKMLEDLPLFWRGRVSQIDDNSLKHEKQSLINGRNLIHRKSMTASHDRGCEFREWKHGLRPNPNKWHRAGNHTVLPLDEKYIKIGYRS